MTLEPDDLLRAEPRRRRQETNEAAPPRVEPVARRQREETQVRHHAFLHQTLPPNDPLVREMERRRSGSDDE